MSIIAAIFLWAFGLFVSVYGGIVTVENFQLGLLIAVSGWVLCGCGGYFTAKALTGQS